MVKVSDISFDFGPTDSSGLISIYEKFLELLELGTGDVYDVTDLGKMPKANWYNQLSVLIENYGIEDYRLHLIDMLEKVSKLQLSYNQINRKLKIDSKNGIRKHIRDYIEDYSYESNMLEAPTHYYFYCSEKGRYLRGLLLSVHCMPDPLILKTLESFAINCPFQVGSVSQAPTGLYIYDILEVFSKLDYPKQIPYILNLQSKIKQTWAQKKIEKYIKDIAKKNKVEYDKIIELGISDYGFNAEHTYQKELGDYILNISFPSFAQKKQVWIESKTGKEQKSIPKELKVSYTESLKYIKTNIKDIELQLDTQSKRIERAYLFSYKWDISFWLGKYYKHPFIGIISKNIVWIFISSKKRTIALFNKGVFVGLDNKEINFKDFTEVLLWHPILSSIKELELLKTRIENTSSQPFKQVDREFYSLSHLESQIGSKVSKATLSQLCKSRGWTSSTYSLSLSNYKIKLLVEENVDDTRGIFNGGKFLVFNGLEVKQKAKVVKLDSLDKVLLSEILRDLELFISKSAAK